MSIEYKPMNLSVLFLLFAALLILNTGAYGDNPSHPECMGCHNLHSSPGQTLLNNASINALCLSCHGVGAAGSTLEAEVHSGTKYGAFEMGCADCHNAHNHLQNWRGGTNLKQIGHRDGEAVIWTPNSGTRNVVFESRGTDEGEPSLYSFADGDEDGDGTFDNICEVCHTQTSHHRNSTSGGDHTHYVGQTCTDCHSHTNFFAGSGGGCTGCHGSVQNGRRAVAGEFSLTSHHVMGGSVTDDDCGVCHYESIGAHMDGNVDLLDPDSGARLTPFASFSRNLTSDSLESWVTDVQDNHCFKCHDSDGATATNFSGNALRPFSSGTTDVPNVLDQFSTSNNYHHAVRAAGNNPFCNTDTMNVFNQGDHDQISCFDCHAVTGHGSSNQRMLRTSIDLDTMEAGTATIAIGADVEAYCTICHKSSVYVTGTGASLSKFEYHPSDTSNHGAGGGNELGCLGCHAGIVNETIVGDNGSARGNLHGGSFPAWGSDSWADGATSYFFMVGGYISGWKPNTSAGENGCGGGNCSHPGSVRQSKPGKEYTRTTD